MLNVPLLLLKLSDFSLLHTFFYYFNAYIDTAKEEKRINRSEVGNSFWVNKSKRRRKGRNKHFSKKSRVRIMVFAK